jgi:hypothetical protein
MPQLRDRLEMLKQMRWREAHTATGAENDLPTDRLIRLHCAIVAIEAALAEGAPSGASDLDVDGHGLTEVGLSIAQANSDAFERYQAVDKDASDARQRSYSDAEP